MNEKRKKEKMRRIQRVGKNSPFKVIAYSHSPQSVALI